MGKANVICFNIHFLISRLLLRVIEGWVKKLAAKANHRVMLKKLIRMQHI